MRRFGRRRFVLGSVAAVCVGCASNETPELRPATTGSPAGGSAPVLPERDGSIEIGPLAEVRSDAATSPLYVPAAKAWLVALSDDEATTVAATADPSLQVGLEHGLLALWEKCPHLGCRVPFCSSSEWFECACHGAHFTRTGEHRAGPGPRGLDPLPLVVVDGVVWIGVTERIEGAPAGTVLVEQPPSGPHCVEAGTR